MKIILFACLALIAIQSAHSLLCYECEGEPGGDCAKGVESAMQIVDCPSKGGLAYAMCVQSDIRNGNTRTFSRGCTTWSNPTYCTLMYQLAANNPMGLRVFSCAQCDTPKCNNKVD